MSSTQELVPQEGEPSLVQQRKALRRQLVAQRQLIALKLEPEVEAKSAYPRSRTMRFLRDRPGLAVQLAAGLVGGRAVKSITIGLAVLRMLRSFLNSR